MKRVNEFKEELSEVELKYFVDRIRRLSDEKIDKLWHLCGFIISDRERKFKAIRQIDLDSMRNNLDSAKETVWNLIAETPVDTFKKNLSKVEK